MKLRRTLLIIPALFLICSGTIAVNTTTAYAADTTKEVTQLKQVPATLSEPLTSRLISKRSKLTARLSLLKLKFETFNKSDCITGVEEGSSEDLYCQSTYNRLTDRLAAYDSDARKFNLRIAFQEKLALFIGNAFRMGVKMRTYARQSLKSVKDEEARVLLSIWYAERGDYRRARHFITLPDDTADELREMDELLLSLEYEKRQLLKKSITRIVISGDFDSRLFSRYPHKFSLSLLRAHLNIKSRNFNAALKHIELAREMNVESQALTDTEVYVRQMKASTMEKRSPTDLALITQQKNLAHAYAGWSLGMHIMNADMNGIAIRILTESARIMAKEGNIEDSTVIYELVNTISKNGGKKSWLPSPGTYATASEADILLDALEYGKSDWNRSLEFLKLAQKASPHNQKIKEAMAHAQALLTSQP